MKARPITREALLRLIFSLGLFSLMLAVSSVQIYHAILDKAAHERAADLANFYQSRLTQLDQEWERERDAFRVRIENTRFLENPKTAAANLQAFMTVRGANRRFEHILIENKRAALIFSFGAELDLPGIPLEKGHEHGWYQDPASGDLYRVFADKIWLGATGVGRMALFYPVNNALLQQLTSPSITLTVLYGSAQIARTPGQRGLNLPATTGVATELRDISWSGVPNAEPRLRIEAPVKALFSSAELAIGASAIPIFCALILWFTLGLWLMRNTRRINELGWAVNEFSATQEISDALSEKIHHARGKNVDEIHQVAEALENMAVQSVAREQERRKEETQRSLAASIFECSSEAMAIADPANNLISVNPAFTQITGYSANEALGKNALGLLAGHQDEAFYREVMDSLANSNHWAGEVWDKKKSGEDYAVRLVISAIPESHGSGWQYVAQFADITEKKKMEEVVSKNANFDSLTGLSNRRMFLDFLEQEIKKSHRSQINLALMFLDLDRFKEVNDTLGHAVGDKVLVEAAKRIVACVRESDIVSRLGGDEFTVILPEITDVNRIENVAHSVIHSLGQPYRLGEEEISLSASVGITIYPTDGTTPDDLIRNADQAMYLSKSEGRNRFHFFTEAMQNAARRQHELAQDLRVALREDQFQLYFQPIVDLRTGELFKAEALLRWQHPVRGMVSPVDFIPVAEEIGLIDEISDWVFNEALAQGSRWAKSTGHAFRIGVNISPLQLRAKSSVWLNHVHEMKLTGESVSIEITEGTVLNDRPELVKSLQAVHEAGMEVAIDNFGTGSSSLSHLQKLKIDYLKIDQSFTRDLAPDSPDLALSEAIIAMAHKLAIKVIAEGIETSSQRDLLATAGCDFGQGYLFSRPVPTEEFETLLHNGLAAK